ncbi:unnamed protein product [Prunus armeniaca]
MEKPMSKGQAQHRDPFLSGEWSLFIGEEKPTHLDLEGRNLHVAQYRVFKPILVGCANLTAWCCGPRGCALTRDVLLLDAVRLCAGVPARSTVRRDGDEV